MRVSGYGYAAEAPEPMPSQLKSSSTVGGLVQEQCRPAHQPV